MTFKPKGRKFYIVKFMWNGRVIQIRTKTSNGKVATRIEAKLRNALAMGTPIEDLPKLLRAPESSVPTLGEFLTKDFEPFVKTEHDGKPNTLDYYHQGIKKLKAAELAGVRLDTITTQHVAGYVAQHGQFQKSTINRDLRVLRRALTLAVEWGKLPKSPKVALLKGENRRERVLTDSEAERYLAACPQLWRDVATVLLGSAMRPGEAYALDWRNILLNGSGGLIQITEGKTKAAQRLLPMVPRVYECLKVRHEAQGRPTTGWVFPTGSLSGHIEESSAKQWHAKALAALAEAHKEKPEENPKVEPFVPYALRHTALTRLADSGCDAFTLARIAGHSGIAITSRYVHPQAEAVERAFQKLVTTGGYQGNCATQSETQLQTVNIEVSKG